MFLRAGIRRIVGRIATYVAVGPVIGMTAFAGQAAASTVPSAPACSADGWVKVTDSIGESYSPWMPTAKSLDFTRSIQFRALGGELARNCSSGKQASFMYASAYRLKSCLKPTACQLSDWINYSKAYPTVGHRFPDQAVGWDPYYNIFRPYKRGVHTPEN